MVRRAVRNLNSTKTIPPRLFDVIVDKDNVKIEIKIDKNSFENVPWNDILKQVESAKEAEQMKQELPQNAP